MKRWSLPLLVAAVVISESSVSRAEHVGALGPVSRSVITITVSVAPQITVEPSFQPAVPLRDLAPDIPRLTSNAPSLRLTLRREVAGDTAAPSRSGGTPSLLIVSPD